MMQTYDVTGPAAVITVRGESEVYEVCATREEAEARIRKVVSDARKRGKAEYGHLRYDWQLTRLHANATEFSVTVIPSPDEAAATFQPFQYVSNWGYWVQLNGERIKDGEPLRLRSPDGKTVDVRIKATARTIQIPDMGHSYDGLHHSIGVACEWDGFAFTVPITKDMGFTAMRIADAPAEPLHMVLSQRAPAPATDRT